MKKNSKFYKVVVLILGLIILCTLIATLIVLFKNNVNNPSKKEIFRTEHKNSVNTNKQEQSSFFPKKINLNQEKIYSLIRIKNGNPFFKKELVSLLLNQVIQKGSFVNGKLKYWYKFEDNDKLLNIAFKWQSSSGKIQEKTYIIKLVI